MFDVDIVELESIELATYAHQGDYMNIGKVFEKLFIDAAGQGLINETTRSFGLYYDDPKSVASDELRSKAGIIIADPKVLTDNHDFELVTVPAGKYASLLFKGSYAELEKPYDWLFGYWLPESGHEAGDFPPVEEYLNDSKTMPPSELLTRINCLLV